MNTKYIHPRTEVMNIESESHMMAHSGGSPSPAPYTPGFGSGYADDGYSVL